MSLFSRNSTTILTITPVATARSVLSESDTALFRLLSLSVVLALLIMMTVVAIFVVRRHQVPVFHGIGIGDNQNPPKMVQALETLHLSHLPSPDFSHGKGGELNESRG